MKLKGSVPAAFVLLLPALICLAVFRLYPIALAAWGSFCQESFEEAGRIIFVGLQNYADVLGDPLFWKSLWVTLKLNAVINPIQVVLALLLTVMVNQRFRGIAFYRLLLFVPIGVSLPIACVIWRLMLDPQSGLINSLLGQIGIDKQRFLIDEHQALWSVMAIATWKGVSFWMIFLWAGLQAIPSELYEAARLDGATAATRFFYITLPLLKRTLLFVLVTDTSVNFLLFVPMFLLTRGGPSYSTNVLMYESYRSGFIYGEMGRALAIMMVLILLVSITVVIQFYCLRQKESS
ncbi:MAG: sugar ABC transporter permease [Verrucomicrobia bacterium]|nr:sugar ABC transporter permease [Verrucomicrobiota bacterium]